MSELTDKKGPHIRYFDAVNDAGVLTSDAYTRYMYTSTTIYAQNPAGLNIDVQVSPDGTNWYTTLTSTDTEFIHQLNINTKYIRIVKGAGAGVVTVESLSSGTCGD